MHRRTVAAGWTFFLATAASLSAVGQNVYKLHDPNTGSTSTVKALDERLEVLSGGVLYLYQRDDRLDRAEGAYYYNTTLDQALLWPHNEGGVLWVRKPGETRFRPSGMQIAAKVGQPNGGNAAPGANPQQTVVIESALPGGGLVTAKLGGRGNIEIGAANGNDVRNQFYVQARSGGYLRLIPATDPDMVIDIFRGNAAPGANVDMWKAAEVDPSAGEFRLAPAGNGYFQIESRLRPGVVWDVDGAVATGGTNIRLMNSHGGPSQLFRISRPQDVGQASGPAVGGAAPLGNGIGVDGSTPLAPAQPLAPAKVNFANTGGNELLVVIVDSRAPGQPMPLRIASGNASTLQLQRDPLGRISYDVSVYEMIRQSVVIDRTARGGGAVTDEQFSPRSVGLFRIPGDSQLKSGLIDVYRKARSARNPGAVARIEPEQWQSVEVDAVPVSLGGKVSSAAPPVPGGDDPDGPFGTSSGAGGGAVAGGPAMSGLTEFVADAEELGAAPLGELLCAHLHAVDENVYDAELIWWTAEPYTVEVEVPYTEVVVVNGVETTEQRVRVESREKLRQKFALLPLTLAPNQMQAYRADGTQLDAAALAAAVGQGAPAVVVRAGMKLDSRLLSLLKPDTLVIAPDGSAEPGRPDYMEPGEAGPDYPSTPLTFREAVTDESGRVAFAAPYVEQVDESYVVEVPVTKLVDNDGELVEVTEMIEETRIRIVTVWKPRWEPLGAGSPRLYEMSGQRVAAAKMAQRLASPRAVVFVEAGGKIDPWYRKVLRPDARLVMVSQK
ncbi:MAG: RICIN domain-containing protein [Planctomycetales bacterium]|nr:RICIN domain-containing protein [Planctomycetales bacterium]